MSVLLHGFQSIPKRLCRRAQPVEFMFDTGSPVERDRLLPVDLGDYTYALHLALLSSSNRLCVLLGVRADALGLALRAVAERVIDPTTIDLTALANVEGPFFEFTHAREDTESIALAGRRAA